MRERDLAAIGTGRGQCAFQFAFDDGHAQPRVRGQYGARKACWPCTDDSNVVSGSHLRFSPTRLKLAEAKPGTVIGIDID